MTDIRAEEYNIPDPPLTTLGFEQAEQLQDSLQQCLNLAAKVELIVVSPMRRTLQTVQYSLQWLISQGVPVQLRGEWQSMVP